jgi:hypothetical protein
LDLKLDLLLQEDTFQLSNEPIDLDKLVWGVCHVCVWMRCNASAANVTENIEATTTAACKIDGAISRIETDEYGFCFVCGVEIDSRRLALEPTSTRCLACMESGDS